MDMKQAPFDEDEVLVTCALRFDGYAYISRARFDHQDALEQFFQQGVWPANQFQRMALFFFLQRFLYKWGGEQLPRTSKHWKAFRSLFLLVCRHEVPKEFLCTDVDAYSKWERVFKPRLEAVSQFIKQLHTSTAYDEDLPSTPMSSKQVNETQVFSLAITEKLGYYVYLLIDPETDEVFYVGKGVGNRLFEHLHEAATSSRSTDKLDRIRAIQEKGLSVKCRIHRHGLTEKEALEVEASLIDFIGLLELANQVQGHKSEERGQMTVQEIIAKYDPPHIEITEPAILIIVNRLYQRDISAEELYEITRGNWVIGKRREQAKYAFAVYHSIVREVYEIERWYPVETDVSHQKVRNRWRFEGKVAHSMQHYIGGSVTRYLTPGAQSPIRFINCPWP
jgi:hypothetical protein